jgi:molybdenum storage protein
MSKLIKEKGKKGRLHIDTPLMGESLVSKEFLKRTEAKEYFRMQPDINVLKIGGQSIIDRGARAVLPIVDVLLKAKNKHKIILMTGGEPVHGMSIVSGSIWACLPGCFPSWEIKSLGRMQRC